MSSALRTLKNKYDVVRQFLRGVRIAGIATASVVIGLLLFYSVPQAQDLFLEVRGNWAGPYFWIAFYASVLFAWALPVYVSARWIIWKSTEGLMVYKEGPTVEPWVARLVPPVLATLCFVAVMAGQFVAMENMPQPASACIGAVESANAPQGGPAGQVKEKADQWTQTVRCELGGLKISTLLLYLLIGAMAGWIMVRRYLFALKHWALRIPAKIAWWLLTLVGLVVVGILAIPLYGFFKGELQDEFSVAHLAVLPAASALCAWLVWRGLRVRPDGKASPLGDRLMRLAGASGDIDRWAAMRRLWSPVFYVVLLVAVAIVATLFLVHPVDVTHYVYRALLVPFFLGLLVPVFTYISHLSRHTQVPLVVGSFILLGIFSITESNDVRTTAHPTAEKQEPSGKWKGMWPGHTQRPSINDTVHRWAQVNGCRVFVDTPELAENCPRPILISAAGGASRAGFLVASLIGKLIDQRKEQDLKIIMRVGGKGTDLGKVNTAAYDPNGLTFVTAHDNRTARVWNLERGDFETVTFNGKAPDGEQGLKAAAAALQDTLFAKQTKLADARPLSFNSDFCQAYRQRRWQSAQINPEAASEAQAQPVAENLPACGRYYEVEGAHFGAVNTAAFHASDRSIITASNDYTVRLWHRGELHLSRQRDSVSPSDVIDANLPQNLQAAMKHHFGLSYAFGSRLASVMVHDAKVVSAVALVNAVDAGGPAKVATMTSDGIIRIWNPGEQDISGFRRIPNPTANYTEFLRTDWWMVLRPEKRIEPTVTLPRGTAVLVSPDGQYVAGLYENAKPAVFSAASGKPVFESGLRGVTGTKFASFSPVGNMFAYAYDDKTVSVLDTAGFAEGRATKILDINVANFSEVLSATFSPDGGTIATGHKDGTVRFWTIAADDSTGRRPDKLAEPHETYRPHTKGVRSIAFNPTGTQLLTVANDGAAQVWEPVVGERRTLRPFEQQLFSISSVSGGSLGAIVAYAALADAQVTAASAQAAGRLPPPCGGDGAKWKDDTEWFKSSSSHDANGAPDSLWRDCLEIIMAGDFLSPVFASLVSSDLVGIKGRFGDRAAVLERAWEERYRQMTGGNALAQPLMGVRWSVLTHAQPKPARNWLPMLTLNGTSVATGRRIIASDVDNFWIYNDPKQKRELEAQRKRGGWRHLRMDLFRDSYDLHRMMEQYDADAAANAGCNFPRDIPLSTGATMSARFPVISPHGNIKNRNCRIVDRVVDGGYFENFGAITSLELARVLKDHYGLDPLTILINNEPTASNMDCYQSDHELQLPKNTPQSLAFALIKSPLGAISGTRSARGSLAALELCTELKKRDDEFAFITVDPSPGNPSAELSMSWWLSKMVQRYLHDQLNFGGNSVNWRGFNKIEAARLRQ